MDTRQQAGRKRSTSEATLQPSMADDAADSARDLAAQATSVAQSLSSDLQSAVKATTRAVKAQASEFGADVGHELTQVAEAQKLRGVEAIQGFARAADRAASELAQQSPLVARYVRDAAKQVEDFSNNVRGRSVTDLMQAATDLARSQPALFFAGALAAGFALSRFLKSSAPDGDAISPATGPAGQDMARPQQAGGPSRSTQSRSTPTRSAQQQGGQQG